MTDLLAKVRVLLAAVPYWGAVATSVLTAVGTEVVPLLPENVGVRVAAVVALALGWVATIVRVVSRVTPVPVAGRGIVVPAGKMVTTAVTPVGVTVDVGARRASTITTTNPRDAA